MNQEFRPLSHATHGVMRKAAFLQAVDVWSARERQLFSVSRPPVDALDDPTCDENAELAAIFYRLTRRTSLHDQMSVITFEILVHQRRYDRAWNEAHGERDPRKRAPRDTWVELRPYKTMIEILQDWLEALHDRARELER